MNTFAESPLKFNELLELSECPSALLNDSSFIVTTIHEASTRADLTLLGEVSHTFDPQGVTAIALLAESHLSIHTCRHLVQAFRAKTHTLHALRRGAKDGGPVRVLVSDSKPRLAAAGLKQ